MPTPPLLERASVGLPPVVADGTDALTRWRQR